MQDRNFFVRDCFTFEMKREKRVYSQSLTIIKKTTGVSNSASEPMQVIKNIGYASVYDRQFAFILCGSFFII